ncbi:amidohydrolase family protein [Rhizorhabdus dicambivorans]|uniref:Amidohydrolase-related domain-containing protein n=1 Tax=Rhizorhabdus dicambivorans TaxID=1850238 RepID=A0A2A4FST8_9SPHN|nr:amidohydrolase family protein [Rhizorhabdus dicambivorans]ATE66288.1 hypothetical protein CMV14_19365 [Rhizorhabdus dicambivorans]PCE41805.1 hypothetical protein COO09_13700 [Rhizorhabdus dicambivorans]
MKTLIKNAVVVTVDPAIGDVHGGDILIEDGFICEIAESITAGDAEIIDATGCIAIPGFVDTHRHLWEGALRSVSADWAGLEFVSNMLILSSACFRPRDMYATAYQGGLDCLNAGVTTVADYCHNVITPEHASEAVRGLRESGVRAAWSYSFNPSLSEKSAFANTAARISFLEDFARTHFQDRDDLVSLAVCPQEIGGWQKDRQNAVKTFEVARRLGAPLLVHANAYTRPGGEYLGEVELLDELGLLGPDLTVVHMGFTKDDEWRRLGEVGAHVSFTPETELQMGMNPPPITAAMDAGVNISVGADITANNSGDLFTQLRLALQVERAKLAEKHAGAIYAGTGISCAQALEWGTIGGARALGMQDRIGSITPGKEADIVLIRADGIAMTGWDRSNPAATVVQQAGIHVVDTVLVKGKVVKRDGRLIADERSACELLEETSRYIHEEAAAKGGFNVSNEELMARLNRHILEQAAQA